MASPLIIKREIPFKASPTEVWNLLTQSEWTKQYMFGCSVLSDWQVGSEIIWEGPTEDGTIIVYVQGKILAIDPGHSMTFTMFDPNQNWADVPENYVNLTYELQATEEGTLLTLIQGDYVGADNAQTRYEESIKAWDMVIPMMQKLLNPA